MLNKLVLVYHWFQNARGLSNKAICDSLYKIRCITIHWALAYFCCYDKLGYSQYLKLKSRCQCPMFFCARKLLKPNIIFGLTLSPSILKCIFKIISKRCYFLEFISIRCKNRTRCTMDQPSWITILKRKARWVLRGESFIGSNEKGNIQCSILTSKLIDSIWLP